MAFRSGVRVDGVSAVVRALTEIGMLVEDPKDAMADIADEAGRRVAAAAPKRSGNLAGSAQPETTHGRASVAVLAPYAGVINYGWPAHHINPAGYIQAADEPVASYALQRLESEINTHVRTRGLA